MFQYAIARALSLQNNDSLKIDNLGFATYPHHSYSLQHFNIAGEYVKKTEVMRFNACRHFLTKEPTKTLYRVLEKFHVGKKILRALGYIKESQRTYDPSIKDLKGTLYLDGHWLTEKYFKDIAEILRKDFTLKTAWGDQGLRFLKMIQSEETPVCLHIRRGDFANNPKIREHHGVSPLEYYYAAIQKIAPSVKNPHFFVFSDSMDWVRENLHISYPVTYIDQGPEKNYEDLILMSYCKHHILSNSTFGWWGAWLSKQKEGQIVIAPKKWLTKDFNTSDLLPKSWIQI